MKKTINAWMSEELPLISKQRKRPYRTTHEEVIEIYRILNKNVFKNKLIMPELIVKSRCRGYWGMCQSITYFPKRNKSNVKIILNDKWYCKQWLILTLAHEMCHQYQWDILGPKRISQKKAPIMSHGPSFFKYRDKLAEYGIPLKRSHGTKKWFQHQNLFKC